MDIYEKDAEIQYVKFEAATRDNVCSLMERQDRMNEEIFYKINDLAYRIADIQEDQSSEGALMSWGWRPRNAIDEGMEIAGRRGSVEQVKGKRDGAFDFIIIESDRNAFVKVKRSQISFMDPLEILHHYEREIASLHRVALTSVTAREFWVRSPNGTWQFFLIRHDSVLEIRADGLYIPRESLPVGPIDLSGTPAGGTDDPVSPSKNGE